MELELYAFEERAAIREHDAPDCHPTRTDAERAARAEIESNARGGEQMEMWRW